MSIQELLNPNTYDLLSNSLNTNILEALTQTVQNITATGTGTFPTLNSTNGTIANIITNKLSSNGGLGLYDATFSYSADAMVFYQGTIWKSLVSSNLGNTPSDTSAQWIRLINKFNNVVSANNFYVDGSIGRDTNNANLMPFATINAAYAYAASQFPSGGFNILVISTDLTYTLVPAGSQGAFTINTPNVSIISTTSLPYYHANTISGRIYLPNTSANFKIEGFTHVKDSVVTGPTYAIGDGTNGHPGNVYIKNMYINIPTTAAGQLAIDFAGNGKITGSYYFDQIQTNDPVTDPLVSNADISMWLAADDSGTSSTNIYITNCIGPVQLSTNVLNVATGGVLNVFVVGCRLIDLAYHTQGNLFIQDCSVYSDFKSSANALSGQNSLNLKNVSLFNYATGTFTTFAKTGTCAYNLLDVYRGRTGDTVNGTGVDTSSGPAQVMNQYETMNAVVAAQSIASTTLTLMTLNTALSDPFGIATFDTTNNLITILNPGTYNIKCIVEVQNTATYSDAGPVNIWLTHTSGGAEGTALISSSVNRGLVGNGTILTSYPTSNKQIDFPFTTTTANYNVYIYCRNLTLTTFTVRLLNLVITQLR